jgi:hypothetical protein
MYCEVRVSTFLLSVIHIAKFNVPFRPTPLLQLCTRRISTPHQSLRVMSHVPQLRENRKSCFYWRRRARRLV